VDGVERRCNMNNTTKKSLTLQKKKLQSIDQRMEALSAQGVKASQEHSGELNFSGCASGYCQAWD